MSDRKVQVCHHCFVPGLSFKLSFKKTSDCFAGLCIVYSLMEFVDFRLQCCDFEFWKLKHV